MREVLRGSVAACNPMHPACNPMHPACNPMHPACNHMHPACNPVDLACDPVHTACNRSVFQVLRDSLPLLRETFESFAGAAGLAVTVEAGGKLPTELADRDRAEPGGGRRPDEHPQLSLGQFWRLLQESMRTACARHAHGMRTACARHAHGMRSMACHACAEHAPSMHLACAWWPASGESPRATEHAAAPACLELLGRLRAARRG